MQEDIRQPSKRARAAWRRISGWSAGCALMVGSPLALAQQSDASASAADQGPATAMDTVVVTAKGFVAGGDQPVPVHDGSNGQIATGGRLGVLGEQDAFDVPFNIVSYTAKRVEDKQAHTLGAALRGDPGVQIGSGYGNNSQTFHIRGFELTGDDVSYGGLYGLLPRQLVNPIGAERVEVFKGASAFLNGVSPSGSGVGGSVNIEPKRAEDTPLFRTTVGYNTDDYRYAAIDAGRRFGDDKEWGVRLNAMHGTGDTPINGDDDNRNKAYTLGLDYRGSRLRSSIDVGYERDTLKGNRGGIYLGQGLDAMPTAPSARTNYTPDWNYSRLESTYGMWRGEYDFSDDWTGYAGFGFSKAHEFSRAGVPSVVNSNGDATFGMPMDTHHDEKHFTYQTGVRGHFDTGAVAHAVNLGFSGAVSRSYNAYTFGSVGSGANNNIHAPSDVALNHPAPTGDPSLASRTRANGISLSDTASLFDDQLKLTAGVRYQQLTVRNWDLSGTPTSDFNDNGYTPMYGVVYQPTEHLSLYANYIQSLQAGPQVPLKNGSGVPYPNAGQTLGIVRSKQYETGIKLDYEKAGGALSAFRIEQPNASGNGTSYGLDGKKTVKGIELSGFGEPVDGWHIMGGVTYMNADLKGTSGHDGNDPIGVPKYYATLSNSWEVPGVNGLALTSDVIRSGSQFADDGNRYRLRPWTRLDAGLRYQASLSGTPVTLRANVDNLTNNGYWDAANQSGYVTMGTPRTLRLSASFDL
ncbi:Ferrichrome receptor FcuA [Carnimonas sp. R-84981]|uniref:TonB-dependent receptor n=1 Tax=Carnimonas bestiolae TaxID=3402172 RepID=UPI003EDC206A